MITFSQTQSRGLLRRAVLGVRFFGALLLIAASVAVAPTGAFASYGWPVKPFDRPHPVRGSFGDPRTVFVAPPTEQGLLNGGGSFSFHFGIDVSAPDGTAVYPVASGVVTAITPVWVEVGVSGGRSFQYWHIQPVVRVGDHVSHDKTVLGHILRGAGHVHFSELMNRHYVNPLREGHLEPYADTTKPTVEAITFRGHGAATDLLPNFVRGSVEMVAEAYDTPEMPVPGEWNGLPVAPTVISWRIQGLGGKVVVPETIAADFRNTIPANRLFWTYYARGTYQNMSVFGAHFSWRQPGCFLFKLTHSPFDTTRLHDGAYDLVVTATDIRGNRSSRSRRFTVHNRPGWVGA